MAEPNPYVGPRPFQPGDRGRFYGRDGEINQLVPLLYAHRLTVLFAQSGAGKTSLLNAGVLPRLIDDEGFDVVGSTRVSGIGANEAEALGVRNIYTFNALSGWLPADQTPPGDATIASFLSDREHRLDPAGDAAPRVVVFDQFEEVFTAYPDRWQERDGFFRQLRDALDADPMLRIVLSLREDYLANLDPHLAVFRGVSTLTFRLERLKADEALSAVVDPLKGTSRSFAKGVANKLVADLMQVRVEREGELVRVAGEYAEPVQLQVVCARLWQQLPDEVTEITAANLESFGDIDQALTDFYEEALAAGLKKGGVKEPKLRDWFQRTLVTSAGTRSTVYQDQKGGTTGGMPNDIVQVLEDAHIVRGETLRGSRWFELTHDRFVEPIRTSNAEFRSKRRRKRARRATIAVGAAVAGLVAVAAFFALRTPMLDAEPIESGQVLTDVAVEAGVTKRYRFSADAEQAVTLELSSADLDAVSLRLVRIEDEELTTQLGGAQALRTRQEQRETPGEDEKGAASTAASTAPAATRLVRGLPESGDYAIEVSADRSGAFTLLATVGEDQRPPLELGAPQTGVIEDAEAVDRWLIKGVGGGDLIQIRVGRGAYLDSIISLVDSTNEQIGFADSFGDGGGERLVAQLPVEVADGEYVVEVSGFAGSVGIYEVELLTIETADLAAGEEQPGSITEVGETQTYTFEGVEAAVVEIRVQPKDADFDPTISLDTLLGEEVGYEDSGINGEIERMVTQLPADGGYLVTIGAYEDYTGEFSVTLAEPSLVAPIAVGGDASGEIDSASSAHVYQFSGDAGQLIAAEVQPQGNLLADVALGGPTGLVSFGSGFSEDPARLSAILPVDGEYFLVVSGYEGSIGSYEVQLGGAEVRSLAFDEDLTGSIEDSDEVDYYEFEADAATAVVIQLAAPDVEGGSSFSVYGEDGEFLDLGFADDPGTTLAYVEMEILTTGSYVVEVNFFGGTGDYTLNVTGINPFEIDPFELF